MPLDIKFRTDNPPLWSAYSGNRLPNTIADQNMYNIKVAIEELQTDRPQPDNIASIQALGVSWVVTFDSARQLTVPVQVLAWGWRGFWTPFTSYQAFNGFAVEGVGLFYVNVDHVSPATFDAAYQVGGEDAYHAIYLDGTAANSSIIYDTGFFFGPKLSDNVGDILWELPSPRALALPVTGHFARMKVAPSTADQVMPILHGGVEVGTITFAIGIDQGTIDIPVEIDIAINEMLGVGEPTDADATAAGLSVVFAMRRVV